MVWCVLLFVLFLGSCKKTAFSQDGCDQVSSDIRLNSIGFLPRNSKKATIISNCSDFKVKNSSNGKTVYSGTVKGPLHQEDVDQDVWIADFSELQNNGTFYLDVSGVGCSIKFEIKDDIYDEIYRTVMRGFYLWRCGTAVEAEYNGNHYKQEACHLEDGWQDYIGIANTKRDGVGGWHDAGDYGKYAVNAGFTVGVLFMAWDHFQDKIENISLDLPDTAPGYPDFLKELKWETDWLLKMPYPDGSGKVSHKLTRLKYCGYIMPKDDKEKRYFTDWGSTATADFTAAMAMAGRYFKPYDPEYAKTCLDAAIKSYEFLKNNPEDKQPDLSDFPKGTYTAPDPDDRLWAAAEMWETTGEKKYLSDFEEMALARKQLIDSVWDWMKVGNIGMFTYALSDRQGRNPELVQKVRQAICETADKIVEQTENDVYGRSLGNLYYWGCNGTVARQTVILLTANKIKPKADYVNTALDALAHLFGRNYYGRSYVTGIGHRPPMYPHDRRCGADGIDDPWPGYIVGGGHSATEWNDEQTDYRTNEIAINWQAALVYALSAFTEK